jgi:hypothetical protein
MTVNAPCRAQQEVFIDFENGDRDLDRFVIIDEEPRNLGDQGPSTWEVRETELAFDGNVDGNVLYQGSNIWGDAEDHMLMGTIIYFAEEQYANFRLEVDVIANDNDGMGPVWGYTDLDSHYRIQLMNDRWPEIPPVDGYHGPMIISHKRVSNDTPWYEVMDVIDDPAEYIPYPQGVELHWTLEVMDGEYEFTWEDLEFGDSMTISGSDDTYSTGYVGIQLYAQQAEFDNFQITPLGGTQLQPGDADQNLQFDQLDLVKVQVAAKYLTGQSATWGEGDWNEAPGGEPGNPPVGDGQFNQLDIIAALNAGWYLQGPYAAIAPAGVGGNTGGLVAADLVYVPEPSTLALLGCGLAAALLIRRRR